MLVALLGPVTRADETPPVVPVPVAGSQPPAASPNLPSERQPLVAPAPQALEKGAIATPAVPPQVIAIPESDQQAPPSPEAVVPVRVPEFFGDQAPIGSLLLWPWSPGNSKNFVYVPSARYFKISDDDSPRPLSRSYFSFNYFYNLNNDINQAAGGGIQHTRIHREIFGAEWASGDDRSSVGLRLPLDTFNAANTVYGLDGASTDIGDLTVILKELLWDDPRSGSLISAGLAVTPPTGPGSFAGSNDIKVFHNTSLQPFCGWILSWPRFYLQGFTAVDAPTDLNDVVMLSNDFAAGYFLYQRPNSGGLTAVVPTIEVHVNTPLNHRGVLSLTDPAGNPDTVDLTGGVHLEYQDHSSFGVAFAVPVTGPRMFDFEILAQFRWRY
jgi:hypothetical protein